MAVLGLTDNAYITDISYDHAERSFAFTIRGPKGHSKTMERWKDLHGKIQSLSNRGNINVSKSESKFYDYVTVKLVRMRPDTFVHRLEEHGLISKEERHRLLERLIDPTLDGKPSDHSAPMAAAAQPARYARTDAVSGEMIVPEDDKACPGDPDGPPGPEGPASEPDPAPEPWSRRAGGGPSEKRKPVRHL